jgi:hypothetical protein
VIDVLKYEPHAPIPDRETEMLKRVTSDEEADELSMHAQKGKAAAARSAG